MHWRLFIEEYHPIFHYIKGTENTLADALSCLPHSQRQIATISQLSSPHAHTKALGHKISEINSDNHYFSFLCDDEDLLECFLNFPPVDWAHPFALDFLTIHTAQLADAKLQIISH